MSRPTARGDRSDGRRDDGVPRPGALLVTEGWFVQALEGEEQAVRSLYEHIARDGRHEQVAVVDEQNVDGRAFGRWSMAQVSDDGEPDIPLLMNRDKGGITRAAPRPTSSDQDAVLDYMRGALGEG